MNYVVFAVFDRVAGFFAAPQLATNKDSAVRAFNLQCEKSPWSSDMELYIIGSFNGETGELIACKPDFVCRFERSGD